MNTPLAERILAAVLLLLFSPLIVIAILVLFLLNGAPVFFFQERIGKNHVPFTIVKLRTMVNGKITPFSAFLRATGIDEFPQIWNIIRGDMQFIGPRPLTQQDIDRLGWNTPAHDLRFSVKPGITGFGQFVSECDPDLTLTHDYRTLHRRFFPDSLLIIFLSIAVIFLGKSFVRKYL